MQRCTVSWPETLLLFYWVWFEPTCCASQMKWRYKCETCVSNSLMWVDSWMVRGASPHIYVHNSILYSKAEGADAVGIIYTYKRYFWKISHLISLCLSFLVCEMQINKLYLPTFIKQFENLGWKTLWPSITKELSTLGSERFWKSALISVPDWDLSSSETFACILLQSVVICMLYMLQILIFHARQRHARFLLQ